MGYQKIAQRNPKTGVQKKFKNCIWGKSYMQMKVFGSMRVPLRILSKFIRAQQGFFSQNARLVKEYVCANFERIRRGTLIDPKTLICI